MGLSGKMILMALCLAGFVCSASAVNFRCEDLPTDHCAFAVSSSGARCVLETNVLKNGQIELECLTSEVVTDKFSSFIESSSCIKACGLNRMSVGLSTDFLGEKELQRSICAPSCLNVCPNVEELFTMLAGGEGVRLHSLCSAYKPAPVVVATAAAVESAVAVSSDKKIATAPRKLIKAATATDPATVASADAPAAASVWSFADRRMLYNIAPVPAVAPVEVFTPASSPVSVTVPAPAVAVAPTPVITAAAALPPAVVVPAPVAPVVVEAPVAVTVTAPAASAPASEAAASAPVASDVPVFYVL